MSTERSGTEPGSRRAAGRYARILGYTLRHKRALFGILFFTVASSAAAALTPWPMKILVDWALGSAERPEWLQLAPGALVVGAALCTVLLYLLNSVLGTGLSLCWTLGGQRVVYSLAADVFRRLQRLSLAFHDRRSVGDSLSRLTGDTWCVFEVVEALLTSPLQQILTFASMGAIAFALDPLLAALTVGTAPLLALSAVFFGGRLKLRSKLGREAHSRLAQFVHQTLGAIPAVQVYGTEARNSRQFGGLARELVAQKQRGNLVKSSFGLVNGLVTTLGTALVLYVGGMRVLSGAISLGTLLVFLTYVRQLQEASKGLFQIYSKVKAAEASMERVFEILDAQEIVHEAPDAHPVPAVPGRRAAHVRFEGVAFAYEPGRPVLEGIDLEARPGECVALVGRTGAGKSTVASLLLRFYDPTAGRITLNGVDLREIELASLRANVSVVLQDPLLLPLSVADNIAYGRPGARRDEIVAAAVAAEAAAFIEELPQGYDTVIGEQGATLSGGERQRLAIARALLKDAPLLILDEPTSALDARTDASIVRALRQLMRDRTSFIIAHRLSTIRHADRILVLERGRIVEAGTHAELIALGGRYQRAYGLQFAGVTAEAGA